MTVSRALRGDRNHSAAMRERIQKIARKLGYRPNPLVSALMSARARARKTTVTAGLALLNLGTERDTSKFGFAKGVFEQAGRHGYAVEEYAVGDARISLPRLRSILVNRGVRGIVIYPAPWAPYHLHFDFDGFAAVAIGYSIVNERLPRVTSDAYLRTLEAIRELSERGYRRIGFVSCLDLDHRFNFGMSAGADVSHHAVSAKLSVYRFVLSEGSACTPLNTRDRRRLAAWLRRHRIEVVMSQMNDLYGALRSEGFHIPADMAYLHLYKDHHLLPHGVAYMDQLCDLTGRTAVDQVAAMINRNEFGLPKHPTVVMTPSIWRDGLTVPVLRK